MALRRFGANFSLLANVRRACLIAITLVFCVSIFGEAMAQSSGAVIRPAPGKSRSFNPLSPFLKMFGVETRKRRTTRSGQADTSTRRTSTAAAPRFVETPKDPDAGIILVVGDRMARGIADGLAFTLADKPMVRVETLTEDKSGLAGDNAPDWNGRVLAKVRGADVKAVVITMGREDLGKRFLSEPPIEFGVDAWWSTYEKKVGSLVRTIRQERKPVLWVGLAPTGNALTNTDFVLLNDVFRGQTEAERGYFIGLWDVFLSDAGEYSSYGPDVDGKNLRLRTNDKIGFTWAGYRKVAFFVERQLSRLLGGYGGLAFEGVEDDPDFIVLTGRTTSPEDVLLGGDVDQETGEGKTLAHQYFVEGRPLQSVAGRVDNTARISQ